METLQQAADFALEKIIQQGKQCAYEESEKLQCIYGDGQGNHCAIGWLLDHNDEKLMSSKHGVAALIAIDSEKIPDIIKDDPYFFAWLQQFHDKSTCRERKLILKRLKNNYSGVVDFSSPNWQRWIDMGDDDDK